MNEAREDLNTGRRQIAYDTLVERNHGLRLALAVDVSDDVHHSTRLHLNASMEGRRGRRRKEGRT